MTSGNWLEQKPRMTFLKDAVAEFTDEAHRAAIEISIRPSVMKF